MERRRTIRLLTDKGLVSIGRRGGELLGAGWPLRDISEGGLRFAVPADHPRLPKAGEDVVVTVELAGSGEGEGKATLQLSATVRSVRKAERGEREVSLEFTGLSAQDRERIRGAVLDLAMEKIEKRGEALARRRARARGDDGGRLGDILVARSTISRDRLESFMHEDLEKERPLGRQLVARGLADEKAVARALAEQSGLEFVDLEAEGVDLLRIRHFSEDFLTRHLFLPLDVDTERVTVAAAAPLAEDTVSEIGRQYNRDVIVVIASERQILSGIQKAFNVSRNRRRSARFPVGLSVRFKLYDEQWRPMHEAVLVGLTKNLSEEGVLFVGPKPEGVSVRPGRTNVGVHLHLPTQTEPVRAPCELARTTPIREDEGEGSLLLYGVRVLGVSDADRRRLNLFRLSVCVRRPARGV